MQKSKVNEIISYFSSVIKWVCAAALTGFVCGAAGILFHHSVEIATKLRLEHKIFLYLMPLIGMVIAFLYKTFLPDDKGTGGIFICAARGESPDIKVAPLIFIGTSLTHLAGGSSGREGAALQIGGSIGGNIGKLLRLGKKDMPIIILCGMSAVFSSLFGTPLTAAVFCLEVITVGSIYSFALLPCVISALCAYGLAVFTGVKPMGYVISGAPTGFEPIMAAKVMALAGAAALVSVLFCHTMHTVTHLYSRYFENVYVRIAVGGVIVVALSLIFGTDYNGAGMSVVNKVLAGESVVWYAFLLKIAFTALTLGAGFKGGEIVPAMFIGATFGAVMAPLLGLNVAFGGALGLVVVFCGAVNAPLASIILSVELFGGGSVMYFALACALCFVLSGKAGLYSVQKNVFSRISAERYEQINEL